jgi:hypothetical protein
VSEAGEGITVLIPVLNEAAGLRRYSWRCSRWISPTKKQDVDIELAHVNCKFL